MFLLPCIIWQFWKILLAELQRQTPMYITQIQRMVENSFKSPTKLKILLAAGGAALVSQTTLKVSQFQ